MDAFLILSFFAIAFALLLLILLLVFYFRIVGVLQFLDLRECEKILTSNWFCADSSSTFLVCIYSRIPLRVGWP